MSATVPRDNGLLAYLAVLGGSGGGLGGSGGLSWEALEGSGRVCGAVLGGSGGVWEGLEGCLGRLWRGLGAILAPRAKQTSKSWFVGPPWGAGFAVKMKQKSIFLDVKNFMRPDATGRRETGSWPLRIL